MRWATDENFDGRILVGLTQRLPNLDIVRVQDEPVAGASDPDLLDWLAIENRVLLTHDAKTIPGFVSDRVRAGQAVPGVVVVRRNVSIGQIIEELEVLIEAGEPSDFENQTLYVPLR